MSSKICIIQDCERVYWANDLCCMHNKRKWRNGDPMILKSAPNGDRKTHPLYNTYCGMLSRCDNPTSTFYASYGGRSLTICDRWRGVTGFDKFVADMGNRPQGTSLDRIDNNKGYSPDNCRWATKTMQAINRRIKSNSTTGVTGVYFTNTGRWASKITVNKKVISLGTFGTKEEATRVRRLAEIKYHKPILEGVLT